MANQEPPEVTRMLTAPPPARAVTRAMVLARTLELALGAGRGPYEIKQVDYERAKRELTGESDFDRQQAVLDRAVDRGAAIDFT